MAIHKVSYLAFLLLFGMILLVSNVEHADAKACTRECDVRIAYGICPRSEISNKINLNGICTNCCAGKKGCNYFSADGTFICEGESEYVNEVGNNLGKACTLNCDPRISYGICPRSGISNKINLNGICTNCCAGKKGCNYFSADGTFICEGESEYVSEVDNNLGKACTLNCDPRISYGICPLSEISNRINLNGICTNCCAGQKGCNYFSADGTFICEGESEYVSEVKNNLGKACPRNCDGRIAYGICPYSENKMINLDRICTNCCAGKKGCNYFSADGTFICEGESEYVSERENDEKSKIAIS